MHTCSGRKSAARSAGRAIQFCIVRTVHPSSRWAGSYSRSTAAAVGIRALNSRPGQG
eukprot:COSAG02_NODE_7456_length_3006_cov_1.921913_3_plen_57_part_00